MDEILNTSARLSKLTMEEKLPLKDIGNVAIPSPGGTSKLSSGVGPLEEDKQRFNRLVTMAKKLVDEGQVREALNMNKRALKIFNSERLAKKVTKMEAYLASNEEEEENSDLVTLGDGFCLPKDLYSKLYAHQKDGVLWMWAIHQKKKGGILGDDMGLGKTIQVISFLSGMFDLQKIKSVLIVMPVSLIPTWERELEKWDPDISVTQYHGNSKRNRERALTKVQRRGGICITTYGMVVSSWEDLSLRDGREFTWDYVILDEGHKIKNPTKTSKGVHAIAARNRLIMTGTPIQNNLRELWALFDFVHHGALLGTARTFKMEYDAPITRARERDATAGEKRLGSEMAESLKKIIAPYFLRRTKADVKNKKKNESSGGKQHDDAKTLKMPTLMRKNDIIVWLFLTAMQQKIYEDFLSLDDIKELLMTTKSPLVALTVLKKICDHPRLLTNHACAQLGLHMDGSHDEMDEVAGHTSAVSRIQHIPDATLIGESGKLIILADLLDNLKANGHRCLVFSQSRKILDIIQKVMTNRGHKIMRLDGTIVIQDREDRIDKFQSDPSYSIFLLTTQVGGVGLTLTAADRVVIFDPSWNPATDAQAVDRAFRIGQEKNVVIYRLITCGTVEEKIYRRQIFKDSINQQTTGNSKNPYRYFTKHELRELFELNTPRYSTTQKQLEEMHGLHRRSDPELDGHLAFLHSLDIFGLSDHDLMFSQEGDDDDDEDEENTAKMSDDYIQSRVQKAQELLSMESAMTGPERELAARQPGHSGAIHRDMQPRPGPAVKPDPPMKPKNIKSEFINGQPIFVKDEPMSHMTSPVIDLTDTPANHHGGRKPLHDFANMSIQETDSPLLPVKKEKCIDLESYDSPLKSFLGNDDQEEFPIIEIDPCDIKSENVAVDNSVRTPHIKKMPNDSKNRRIIEEEILISPDGKSPVILTRPKRSYPFSPLTLNRKQLKSEDSSLAKNLYGTLIPSVGASPDGNMSLNDSIDSNTACDKLYMTFVEDTPESTKIPPSNDASSEIFVSDSPACVTRKSNFYISDGDVSERVLETPEYSENEEGSNVAESVLETPDGGNDTKETNIGNSVIVSSDDEDDVIFIAKKRFASKARRLQLESSDEEDAVTSSTDEKEHSPSRSDEEDAVASACEEGHSSTVSEEKSDSDAIDEDSEQHGTGIGKEKHGTGIGKAKQFNFQGISPLENNDSNGAKSDNILSEHRTTDDFVENECVNNSVESASNGDDNSDEAWDSGMDDLENSGIDSADEEEDNSGADDEDKENVEDTSGDDDDGDDGDDDDSDEETDDEPPAEFKEQYQQLILDARALYKQKNFEAALASLLQAIEIHPSEFLQATALRIHQKMTEGGSV